MGGEEVDGGDDEGEHAAGKARLEEVVEGQVVSLLLSKTRRHDVRRRADECGVA